MSGFREVAPTDNTLNIFTTFLKQTPLLTAGTPEHFNTMTIGWGMLGGLWSKNAGVFYVRPCRYTYDFMMACDTFSVSILPPAYKDQLMLLGTKSGRDGDKIAESGLTVVHDSAPYFAEASHVLLFKKLYVEPLKPECFTPGGIPDLDRNYRTSSVPGAELLHVQFIGELVKLLEK